jgi:hypothetical protein
MYLSMPWTAPKSSRTKVDAAGRTLTRSLGSLSLGEYDQVLSVVNNWRASHSWPLYVLEKGLRKMAIKIDKHAITAKRTKRLDALYAKLQRKGTSTMRLTQMEDLGGCRAILRNVERVDQLADSYLRSDLKHKLLPVKDYIRSPPATGYRGIHLIYAYHSDRVETYNGLLIEIQIRSELQHAWATAVEIVDRFKKMSLKQGDGDPLWQRFFSLMGGYIAQREGTIPVPGISENVSTLKREIKTLARKLNVIDEMASFGATEMLTPISKGVHYLLRLDTKSKTIAVNVYRFRELDQALDDLVHAEREMGTGEKRDVETVLASASSLGELKKAFPNYFTDTITFLTVLQDATA